MTRISLIIAFLVLSFCANAQLVFSGKIEFERKKNIHNLMKGEEWFERVKANVPKNVVHYFDLYFDTGTSVYKPGRETDNPKSWYTDQPGSDNQVLCNFKTKKFKSRKNIYEQTFMVEDTFKKIVWKSKDEIRTIAGHQCRKAVGVICDSVYVVAFYAEDIPLPGGPECFGNLPGMILEIAIPRLHTTWTATKIETVNPDVKDLKINEKGKKIDTKSLVQTLKESFSDWGKYADRNITWSIL